MKSWIQKKKSIHKIVSAAIKIDNKMIFRDGIASFSLSFTYFLLIFWRNLVETHLWARVWPREVPGFLWFSSALSLQWIFGQFAYYEPFYQISFFAHDQTVLTMTNKYFFSK